MIAFAAATPGASAVEPDPEALQLLARTIYHEARGEGRAGMLAIGFVVLNRTTDRDHPRTIRGVVTQRRGQSCQWAWVCRSRHQAPTEPEAWREAQSVAQELLSAPPVDPTGGAIWIRHMNEGAPRWGISVVGTARIGNHLFFARPDRVSASRPAMKIEAEPLVLARFVAGPTDRPFGDAEYPLP